MSDPKRSYDAKDLTPYHTNKHDQAQMEEHANVMNNMTPESMAQNTMQAYQEVIQEKEAK